jgi:LPS-assembly protein
MLLPLQRPLQARHRRLRRWCRAGAIACSFAIAATSAPLLAQDLSASTADVADPADRENIAFEADRIEYQQDADTVSAIGNVVLRRADQSVRADRVTWNRETGEIFAEGTVRAVDADGNELYVDRLELNDELKAGAMENMLLALREGGRLAAERGTRGENGTIVLERAAYTGCDVEDDHGCPKTPSWRITARRVTYDPDKKTVRFTGARLELFGIRLMPLPGLVVATDGRAISGPLIPDVRLSASNGVEVSETWYQRLDDNRDIAVTGYVYTKALPMIAAQYRALTGSGAYQITGYVTKGERVPVSGISTGQRNDFRGYVFANGRFQLDPKWSVTFSGRVASDRTFLRRYDISRDDRLRSMVDIERIDADSYLSISGWATQTMRVGEDQGQVPIALPLIDYRRRMNEPLLGGKLELQVNTLAITRTDGQDTQRAFASGTWSLRKLTGMGQEVVFTGLVRGDVYHTDDTGLTATAAYRGNPGWQTRGVAIGAIDIKWPFVGAFAGGTQVFTPRVQLVVSPSIENLAVPNEDSRAIELEISNLFALNRFPGYDRVEDGVRFTYGFDWQWERPNWRVSTTIGQSYRLSSKPTLFPSGTGLDERFSDFVGRTEVRYRDFVKLTHRFRLDKDNLAFRRNEIDATVGSRRTYVEVGYLKLNRDITAGLEDLRDREELRLSARVAFAKYWSIFGSGVFNLTNRDEDPTSQSDGFEALRTRLGVAYQDDCVEIGFTWRRDYVTTGDAERGNTYQLHLALRNLGFRR